MSGLHVVDVVVIAVYFIGITLIGVRLSCDSLAILRGEEELL